MLSDTPNLYRSRVAGLLTGARGVGRADRVRDGYTAYSIELGFRDVDEATAKAKIAWALDQAPYAEIQLLPESTTTGLLTVFARVDLLKLALFLSEHVLLQATGQTWASATGAAPALIKKAINETVGTGAAWASLVGRLRYELASLAHFLRTVEADALAGPLPSLVVEAVQQSGLSDGWATFVDKLRQQERLLGTTARAIETGEYLTET